MASQSAIKAGEAYVELATRDPKFNSGLSAAKKKLSAWGDSVIAMGSKVFAAGMAIDAAFDATAFHFAAAAGAAGKMSARTGIAVGEMSALAFAAERSGGSVEGLETALLHMDKAVVEAVGGGKEMAATFEQLGVAAESLQGLTPDAAFKRLATAVAGVKNPMEQAALAAKVFGRGILEELPLLKKGAAGIEELQQRARDMHLVVSDDDVKMAREFNGMMFELTASLKRVAYEVGKVALPALASLRSQVQPFVTKTIEWIQTNGGLVLSLTKAGLAVAGVGAGIVGVGIALKGLGMGLGYLKLIPKAIGFLTSPIGLITAGLAVGAYAFFKYTKAGQETFADLKTTALDSWEGIRDGIMAGDLGAALSVALAGMGVAWVQTWGKIKQYSKETWSDMKFLFMDAMSDMVLSSGFLTKAFANYGMMVDKVLYKLGVFDDKEMAERMKAGQMLEEADAATREGLKKFLKDKAHKEHGQERDAAKDEFAQDLADAMKGLDEAKAAARAARDKKAKDIGLPGMPGDFRGAIHADTIGTFNAATAERIGGGASSAAERTAVATERTATLNALMLQWMQQNGFVFS